MLGTKGSMAKQHVRFWGGERAYGRHIDAIDAKQTLEQRDVKLQGHPALPQISDAKISATDLRDGHFEVRRASQVTTRNWCFPRQRQK